MSETPTALKAAVIGCGAIAHEHLGFLGSSPLVDLVGVCDMSRATARFAGERYGAKAWFTDSEVMLEQAKPDVVHVLTPPQTHGTLVRRCLDRGAHVICEKPMTATAEETEALLAYARERGRTLVESRNLVFNDGVLDVRKLVDDGTIGAVREVDILLSLDLTAGPFGDLNLAGPGVALPGGAVHDFLPHLAYLLLLFAGHEGEVSRVEGVLDNLSGNPRIGYDHLDVLVFAGQCRGRLRIASDLDPPMFRLTVRGTGASVETDFYNPFLRVQRKQDSGKVAPLEHMRSGWRLTKSGFSNLRDKVMQHGTYHGLPRMLEAIYTALPDGNDVPVSEAEMIATARLVDRVIDVARRA